MEVACEPDGPGVRVFGGDQRVGGDVGEMPFVFQPRARGGDGVGCAFARDLHEDAEVGEVALRWEGVEGLEGGEALRRGGYGDVDGWVW